jgi:hypothetical protein
VEGGEKGIPVVCELLVGEVCLPLDHAEHADGLGRPGCVWSDPLGVIFTDENRDVSLIQKLFLV